MMKEVLGGIGRVEVLLEEPHECYCSMMVAVATIGMLVFILKFQKELTIFYRNLTILASMRILNG